MTNPLSNIPHLESSNSLKSQYPFKIKKPLLYSMSALFVGAPGSGKTSLVTSLLLSHPTRQNPKHPLYYYRFFDSVYIVSGSLQTLDIESFGLPENQVSDHYSEDVLIDILDELKQSDNSNSLVWLDDVIVDLSSADRTLNTAILNRRHITQNDKDNTRAELSIWVSTQKYNMLPLRYRTNITAFFLFETSNKSELTSIRNELLGDLTRSQQDAVFELCWSEPHSFLYINTVAKKGERLHCRFDRIEIPSE